MSAPFYGLRAGFAAAPPRTPEPGASFAPPANDAPPSPPRRMRLKRRAAPRLSAPTQNFLASVAAADVPIPSIEVPGHDGDDGDDYTSMGMTGLEHQRPLQAPSNLHQSVFGGDGGDGGNSMDTNFLSVRGRTFSPPKTPAPGTAPSALSPQTYPNWSIGSALSSSPETSPEPECGLSSRPSTARSTQTSSSSLFSRFSQLSDDDTCMSPDDETHGGLGKPFTFGVPHGPTLGPAHELRRNSVVSDGGHAHLQAQTGGKPRRRGRKSQWTKAMNAHLWSTYLLYLQDPKVTPFRMGKSCVPPHGVQLRVAREAKRSWRGAKALATASAATEPASTFANVTPVPDVTVSCADAIDTTSSLTKSGSTTPTADHVSGTFIEWPFTNAATRAQLRDLCRLKAATPGSAARDLQYMSRSPTLVPGANTHQAEPQSQTQTLQPNPNRERIPVTPDPVAMRPSVFPVPSFATQDMAISLALSTAESMQPTGPLAQMTRAGRSRAYSTFNPFSAQSGARSGHRPHRSLGSHLYHGAPMQGLDASLAAAAAASVAAANAAPVPRLPPSLSSLSNSSQFQPELSEMRTPEPIVAPHEQSFSERRRLGSPFTARSYGPSSSTSLAAVLALSTTARQPHTVGPRRSLQSPVRISRNSTQKARRTKHLSQDLRSRPGLGSDFFTEPAALSSFAGFGQDAAQAAQASQPPSSAEHPERPEHPERLERPEHPGPDDDPFMPARTSMPTLTSSSSAPQLSQAVVETVMTEAAPARLGSPFTMADSANTNTNTTTTTTNTSFSFPGRLFQPADADTAPARPYASVQRVAQPKAVTGRGDLAARLANLDQLLRDINNRADTSASRRRSDSTA